MSVPEDDTHMRDTIDLLSQAAHEYVEVEQDGKIILVPRIDYEKLYWGTRIVSTAYLGQAVVAFKRLEQKALDAKYFMTSARALITKECLIAMYKHYKYGLDAKSSETVRDGKNNQASLVHLIRKQSIEREFTAKDEKARKMLSGWMGSNDNPDNA